MLKSCLQSQLPEPPASRLSAQPQPLLKSPRAHLSLVLQEEELQRGALHTPPRSSKGSSFLGGEANADKRMLLVCAAARRQFAESISQEDVLRVLCLRQRHSGVALKVCSPGWELRRAAAGLSTVPELKQGTCWDESKQMQTASKEEKPQGLLQQEQTGINS